MMLDMQVIPIQEELLLMPLETLIHHTCGFVSCLLLLFFSHSFVCGNRISLLVLFACAAVVSANLWIIVVFSLCFMVVLVHASSFLVLLTTITLQSVHFQLQLSTRLP